VAGKILLNSHALLWPPACAPAPLSLVAESAAHAWPPDRATGQHPAHHMRLCHPRTVYAMSKGMLQDVIIGEHFLDLQYVCIIHMLAINLASKLALWSPGRLPTPSFATVHDDVFSCIVRMPFPPFRSKNKGCT
jgi:hypothetical protein